MIKNDLNEIYKQRSNFILIGLTGRTGSGCTTAADILKSENFEKLGLPKPRLTEFTNNDERKYKIIYDYLKCEHWNAFKVIFIRDIITSFILENDREKLENFLIEREVEEKKIQEFFKIKFLGKFDYHELHEKQKKYLKFLGKKNYLKLRKKPDKFKQSCIDYFFKYLPEVSQKLKEKLQENPSNKFNEIYQKIANNIRTSGEAISKNSKSESKIFSIVKRINQLIKILKSEPKEQNEKKQNEKKQIIVIDSIRNPFEAHYLKERYSAFYLVSINTPDEVRIQRLQNRYNLTREEIKKIDNDEYKSKAKGREKFISQNIKKCIEISDIHLNNPQEGEFDTSRLKKQLAWYIALIIHPGLVTPTKLERCMQIAYSAKLNSGCISRQVGAVVTDQNYSIKAVGWNDTPSGQVPCLLRSVEAWKTYEDKQAFSDYENNDPDFKDLMDEKYKEFKKARGEEQENKKDDCLKGRNSSFCFKDARNCIDGEKNQVHTRSLHAEENAFLQISKYGGEGVQEGILFTTASPCELCAKKAYQLGIRKIIYIDPYPGIANTHILQSGQIKPELELFHGAIGGAYHQLYQPILPFKDELNLLINSQENDLQNFFKSLRNEIKSDSKLKKDDRHLRLVLQQVNILENWENEAKAQVDIAMFALKGMAVGLPLAWNSARACKKLLDKIEEKINDSKG